MAFDTDFYHEKKRNALLKSVPQLVQKITSVNAYGVTFKLAVFVLKPTAFIVAVVVASTVKV